LRFLLRSPQVDDEVYEHLGVSTKIICPLSVVSIPFNLFLVVWAIGEVIVIFSPINLFIKVDLPTFGLPSKVTNPDL